MDVQKVGLHTMMGKMAEEMQEEEPDSPLKVKLQNLLIRYRSLDISVRS